MTNRMDEEAERRNIYREYIEQVVKDGETPISPARQAEILEMIIVVGEEEYRPLAKLLLYHWDELEKGLQQIPNAIYEAIEIRAKELRLPPRYLALYWLALEGRDLPSYGRSHDLP